nr:MBL fold metallo-hydrolase [Allorhizocola rhizosphaerae]
MSGNGSDWYLLNASPDIRTQILSTLELTPGPATRETPLRGVLLTDAELDHVLGLFQLREAATLDVYATAAVLGALDGPLPVRRVVDPYGRGWGWHAVTDEFELKGGLTVRPFPLGDKKPRYASDRDGDGWVVGYRIGDFVYAPCFAQWTDSLDEALDGARVALIDGTFLAADEMPDVKGHLSIHDSASHVACHPGVRFLYTHLNNTNPLLSGGFAYPVATEMEVL